MRPFHATLTGSILNAAAPERVLFIGAGSASVLRDTIAYCRKTDGRVVAVTPNPSAEFLAEADKEPDRCTIIADRPLSALHAVPPTDFALIDDDKNWYTVYHELLSLRRGDSPRFPLTVVYGLGWPCGLRDFYADPDAIPLAYRQAITEGGIVPGSAEASESGGLYAGSPHAIYAGNPQNGVRRAVEDFAKQCPVPLECFLLPENGGMAALVSSDALERNKGLAAVLREFGIPPKPFDRIWESDFAPLQLDRHEWKRRSESLQAAASAAQEAERAARREAAACKTALDEAHKRVARLERELAAALEGEKERADLAVALDAALQSRSDQFDRLTGELIRMHSGLVRTQAVIARVQNTRSWQWTAPLRRLGGIARAIGRGAARRPVLLNRAAYGLFAGTRNAWTGLGRPFPRFVRFVRYTVFRAFPPRHLVRLGSIHAAAAATPRGTTPGDPPASAPPRSQSVPVDSNTTLFVHARPSESERLSDMIRSALAQSLPCTEIIVMTPRCDEHIARMLNSLRPAPRLLLGAWEEPSDILAAACTAAQTKYVALTSSLLPLHPDAIRLALLVLQSSSYDGTAVAPADRGPVRSGNPDAITADAKRGLAVFRRVSAHQHHVVWGPDRGGATLP